MVRAWAALGVATATFILPVSAAWAETFTIPENKLGWSSCLWPAGKVVTVAVDPAYTFPDVGYIQRLDEAVSRWNGVIATSGRGGGVVRVPDGPADIVVQYQALQGADPSEVLGETYLMRDGDIDYSANIGRCPDRRAQAFTMRSVQIRIAPRSDWYVQPDNATDAWQMCPDDTFRLANAALCAARVDFGSTVTHELGHSLVFYHPETLDQIDGVPVNRADSAATQARCFAATNDFAAQATMCSGQGEWRAEQRSLETWDVETSHRAYGQ